MCFSCSTIDATAWNNQLTREILMHFSLKLILWQVDFTETTISVLYLGKMCTIKTFIF